MCPHPQLRTSSRHKIGASEILSGAGGASYMALYEQQGLLRNKCPLFELQFAPKLNIIAAEHYSQNPERYRGCRLTPLRTSHLTIRLYLPCQLGGLSMPPCALSLHDQEKDYRRASADGNSLCEVFRYRNDTNARDIGNHHRSP